MRLQNATPDPGSQTGAGNAAHFPGMTPDRPFRRPGQAKPVRPGPEGIGVGRVNIAPS